MSRNDFSRLFDQLEALSIGFGPVFREFQTPGNNYPPHNIYQLEPDGEIILELAVAGFKKDEVSVSEHQGEVTIRGTKDEDKCCNGCYTHHGIAQRSFVKRFRLAEYYEVTSAELNDGMLIVKFIKNIPDEAKPKTIDIK